jgi:hypothetical protein
MAVGKGIHTNEAWILAPYSIRLPKEKSRAQTYIVRSKGICKPCKCFGRFGELGSADALLRLHAQCRRSVTLRSMMYLRSTA